jgi:acetolactate synthase-1/2/3 large subunit
MSSLVDEHYKNNLKVVNNTSSTHTQQAAALINNKKNIVIFADDFLYKNKNAKSELVEFAKVLGAPVFQVFYGRGPMLFEKSQVKYNPYFVGSYRPDNDYHKKVMQNADLLITLEDRNMYERVVGKLPQCAKIAITSNLKMTKKNKYLTSSDLSLVGNVTQIISELKKLVKTNSNSNNLKKKCDLIRNNSLNKDYLDKTYYNMRETITTELANIFRTANNPILVDDSQMFGGLINEGYEKFPKSLRVFGDHGAFIGGGLVLAAGLARCEKTCTIFNTLGDQSFTNSLQTLVAIKQENLNIVIIVCNNGKSVSLFKQVLSQDSSAFKKGSDMFLYNAPYSYTDLARSFGIKTSSIEFDPNNTKLPSGLFEKALLDAVQAKGPTLIELKLPSDFKAWEGIWRIKGNEKK